LQRACAVADDGDAFAGKIVPVVPSRRVKRLSAERLEPVDLRIHRAVELSDAADEHIARDLRAVFGQQPPYAGGLVEGRGFELGAETTVPEEVEAARAVFEVFEDFRLQRERVRPVRIGRERKRVEVRRHVTAGARIRVVAPRAAHAAGFFEDRERVDAGFLERDGHAEAGGSGSDDGYARRRGFAGCCSRSSGPLISRGCCHATCDLQSAGSLWETPDRYTVSRRARIAAA